MTPNFALGLTELGITLWLRDGTAWLRLGAVAMDAPDLDTQMQALVAKAKEQLPDGIVTKLVIPDDQILYTYLPVEADAGAVRAALDGKTPYPVEELDFDYVAQGDGVLAAVVARETLLEAEEFAIAQGLNPVCFVAAPDDGTFPQEPFFKTARGVRLEADALGRGGPALRESGIFQPPKPAAPAPAKPDEPKADAAKPAEAAKDDATPVAKADTPKADAQKPAEAPEAATAKPSAQPAPAPAAPKGAKADTPKADAPSFRSRRSAPAAPAAPKAKSPAPSARAASSAAPKPQAAKRPALSLGRLGGAGLAAKLRSSLGAPATRAGNGLRSATDLLGRKLTAKAEAPRVPPKAVPAQDAGPGKAPAKPAAAKQPTVQPGRAPTAKGALAASKAAGLTAKAAGVGKTPDPEAERLTVFGARRGDTATGPSLPKRALLISGAALMLVLAVAIWAFYFSRSGGDDLAQPILPEDTTTEVAAPDPLTLPEVGTPEESAEIEAALGATDAAQEQGSSPEAGTQDAQDAPMSAAGLAPEVATPQADAGRLAALRSVRAIAPEAPGSLPDVQAAPAPFGATPLPPLREELTAPVAPEAEEVVTDAPATGLPEGEEALEIVVTQGRPAVVPPARPEGIAPAPPPEPEAALPDPDPAPETAIADEVAGAVAGALADAGAEIQAGVQDLLAPLDESGLVIDVTEGAPAVTPPARPEGIAPEPVAEPAADTPDTPEDTTPADPDQASLTPPPGGVALTLIAPAPRPAQIAQEAAAQAEQFASATPQAVAASLRPSNRPSGFSQTVQRALAAARIRQAAAPAPEPQIVQASAASVAPAIPSSASVSRAATQTRAINLRQINLLGVMGTPSARRALVRLDNGRVVTVRVGERLDGGQVTAIGDSELRYNKRGRDVVLRIAS
ncbi:hypothetical protein [Roseibaca sp. Y0-43]|uniref:hypothetical protein n=1 Tax=Roseibaca sp. Y0-43 TaxID=2816854 RepID=UPI001DAD7CFF|nr:hypothetical protein [Roseibaca sp. Y0-43]MCC1480735.1 hypothetical protein [Roseibaca sp. Y0-43]